MKNTEPLFDPETHYQIEVRGRVDEKWLRSLDGSAEIIVDNTRQVDNITVLNVHTDQSGIVGLVRRLHGLGMTILQFQIVQDGGKSAEGLQILD
jgi:predicted acetyltransferase